MPDNAQLAELVARVGAFHITDKGMKRAQGSMEAALQSGSVNDGDVAEYLSAVERYFEAFSKEARSALRDVDRRLEHVNQVHFNLAAERGVAVKRIEATAAVLADLASLREHSRA